MARTSKPKKTKSIDDLTSRELFAIAERREKEEAERLQAEAREKVETLRRQKREVTAEYRKIINTLNREIRRLSSRRTVRKAASQGRSSSISAAVTKIIGDKGKATTTEIKAALGKRGIDAANISQTLAYLKRNGRITQTARATYTLA